MLKTDRNSGRIQGFVRSQRQGAFPRLYDYEDVLPVAVVAASLSAFAQVSATIDVNTAQTTPLNANFRGFNDEVVFPAEYFDYRLNAIAAQLAPGWVRYPSRALSHAFDWQTGLLVPAWAAQFQGTSIATLLTEAVPWVNGKGGGSFVDGANTAQDFETGLPFRAQN